MWRLDEFLLDVMMDDATTGNGIDRGSWKELLNDGMGNGSEE